jgi:hypothetical protein
LSANQDTGAAETKPHWTTLAPSIFPTGRRAEQALAGSGSGRVEEASKKKDGLNLAPLNWSADGGLGISRLLTLTSRSEQSWRSLAAHLGFARFSLREADRSSSSSGNRCTLGRSTKEHQVALLSSSGPLGEARLFGNHRTELGSRCPCIRRAHTLGIGGQVTTREAKGRGRFHILDDSNKSNALRYDDISTNRWCNDTVACAVNASNR